MKINKYLLILIVIYNYSCYHKQFPTPTIIQSLGTDSLYESLKWEMYQKTYKCKGSSFDIDFDSDFYDIEIVQTNITLHNYKIVEDTLELTFKYSYKNRNIIPNCHGFPGFYVYIISSQKRVGWNEGGVFFQANDYNISSTNEKTINEDFIKYIKRNKVNEWLLYYVKKKGYM